MLNNPRGGKGGRGGRGGRGSKVVTVSPEVKLPILKEPVILQEKPQKPDAPIKSVSPSGIDQTKQHRPYEHPPLPARTASSDIPPLQGEKINESTSDELSLIQIYSKIFQGTPINWIKYLLNTNNSNKFNACAQSASHIFTPELILAIFMENGYFVDKTATKYTIQKPCYSSRVMHQSFVISISKSGEYINMDNMNLKYNPKANIFVKEIKEPNADQIEMIKIEITDGMKQCTH